MAFSNWYYGMDDLSGSSFPCAGDGSNFYLGRIGHETSAGDLTYFDTAAAEKVGTEHTFAVWDVAGPGSNGPKPAGMSPEDWGEAQGTAFITAHAKYSQYIAGQTWFADIETGNQGWVTGTTVDDNTATLFGFLDTIWGGRGEGANTVGVYMHPDRWDEFFGSGYVSQIPIVVWVAGGDCPSTCADAAEEFNATYADMTVGGYPVMIWQYHPSSDCGSPAKDFDITPYAGYQTGKWSPAT